MAVNSTNRSNRRGIDLIVALLAAVMCGCLAPQNSLMVSVDMRSWQKMSCLTYENTDTIALRNINIALRYNDNFKQTKLPLKIAVTTPDARYFEELVELQLQHSGKSLMVATIESVPYRTDVQLNQKGYYTFAFEPQTEVQGVEAVGIEFTE